MNKNMKKTFKIGILLLILIAIIIVVMIYKDAKMKKQNEITLSNLPEREYTEEEAKSAYTKKLINYLNTFQGDFHIKYLAEVTNEDGSIETSNEEMSRRGDILSILYSDEDLRLVIYDDYFYSVNESEYSVYKIDEKLDTNIGIFFSTLDNLNEAFIKSGNEIINDQKYYFEEYSKETDATSLVRYYFNDEDNIAYIKIFKDGSNEQTLLTVEMLENTTYDFMFNISDGYENVSE